MRPQRRLRALGPAAGCALLTGSTTAAAQAPAPAATTAPAPSIAISVADRELAFGQPLLISGRATSQAADTVELQFRPRGAGAWSAVGRATPAVDGRFRVRASLKRSGAVRVVTPTTAAPRSTDATGFAAASRERRIVVAARVSASSARLDVLRGAKASVKGAVRPGLAGRRVRLERLEGKRWTGLTTGKTDDAGRYALTVRAGTTGSAPVRVRFTGDDANGSAQRTVGRLNVYRGALASRYDDYGGPLACGGRLGYRAMVVAHKGLPCGTTLAIRYRGRTVQATVRDRGPYVGGREFDLAGAVARKLGFDGVGTVWVAVQR